MAVTTTQRMNMSFLSTLFQSHSLNRGSGVATFTSTKSILTFSLRDSFQGIASGERLRAAVMKMQASFHQSRSSGPALSSRAESGTAGMAHTTPAARGEDVQAAVERAGGRSALEPWLVDGMTRLDLNGTPTLVDLTGTGMGAATTDARQAAAAGLARFGLDQSRLDGDSAALREDLRAEAAKRAGEQPNLASAIDYALTDALAKIDALGGSATTTGDGDYEKQVAVNMRQAGEIARQLNLGDSDAWGVESLAQDLAVFGMDLTAMSGDPGELAEEIRQLSLQKIAELDGDEAGRPDDYDARLRRITGASARLVNGLQGTAGSFIRAATSSEWSVSSKVTVGGVQVDASSIIAVGNVIVDPLVLDLNGDGIDLKGADEGVRFDMDGDGTKTGMGFIRGDDAFLFVDEYGDGVVRDGRQLFGNTDGYANGFEKLRAYDDNGDGVIDENDAIYDSLRLWVEKKEDGVCDADETMSLREAGIASINLGYQNVREDDGKGNLIGQVGSFTRDDGTLGHAADVWLQELLKNQ